MHLLQSLREPLRRLHRALPAPLRWSLTPLDALDELSSFLPWGPRLALHDALNELGAAGQALLGPRRLVALGGIAEATGAPLRLLTDLGGESAEYWSRLIFAAPPSRVELGTLRGFGGLARTLAAHPELPLLLRQDRTTRRLARRLGAFTLPTWAQSELDVRPPFGEIVIGARGGRKSRKTDVRRVCAQGIEAELSRRPDDVRALVHEWNSPFVRARHGASALLVSPSWERQAPRYCEVLWVHRRGERLGGVLLEPQGDRLRMVLLGVRDDDALREGAVAAIYVHSIHEAQRRGFATLDFGGSRPVLSDGVLAYKRKWGASLRTSTKFDYTALHLPREGAFTRAFLAAHPLIVETASGLRALTAPPEATESDELGDWLSIGGLQGRIVPAGEGWIEAPLSPSAPDDAGPGGLSRSAPAR